ncbi:MAG TPA: sigma-70 family RNA polymerase sigma factor [Candidatus Cloacimonadota bacterium]|nr:sigma-70 family RNA polymerase sigma factor [Candidatus Cloacimonadota bacterium]
MTKEQKYDDILKLAFYYALIILKNEEDAKDIAQSIVIEFFINDREKIVRNLEGWIYITTRNKCYNYIRKRNKDLLSSSVEFDEKLYKTSTDDEENLDIIKQIQLLPSKVINTKNKELLIEYYNKGCDYKKLCVRNIKPDSIRKKSIGLKRKSLLIIMKLMAIIM